MKTTQTPFLPLSVVAMMLGLVLLHASPAFSLAAPISTIERDTALVDGAGPERLRERLAPAPNDAAPPVPMLLWGRVKIDGLFAAPGTPVQACLPGYGCISTTTYTTPSARQGFYVLAIPGDIPHTAIIEGATASEVLTFTVGIEALPLGQSATWQEGKLLPLNLFYRSDGAGMPDECVALNPVVDVIALDGIDATGMLSKTFSVPANAQDIRLELVGNGYRPGGPPQPPVWVSYTFENSKTTTLSYPARHIHSAPHISAPGNMGYVFEARGRPGKINVSINDPDDTAYALLVHYNLPAAASQLVVNTATLQFVWGGNNGERATGPANLRMHLPYALPATADLRVRVPVTEKNPQWGGDQRIAIVRAEAGGVVIEQVLTNPDSARTSLVDLTLPRVPAGTSHVNVSLISPETPAGESQWNNPNAGDSVFLLGATVMMSCSDFASARLEVPLTEASTDSSGGAKPDDISEAVSREALSPTRQPTANPTRQPTASPTRQPTASPTRQPTATPAPPAPAAPPQPTETPEARPERDEMPIYLPIIQRQQ